MYTHLVPAQDPEGAAGHRPAEGDPGQASPHIYMCIHIHIYIYIYIYTYTCRAHTS